MNGLFSRILRLDVNTTGGKIVRWPLRLIPSGVILPILSGSCKGMKWIAGSGVQGCWLGTYESEMQNLIERRVSPGMVAYDIGAQAGIYTLLFSRRVGIEGRVYAFEPFYKNVANLMRHVEVNRLENVRVIQAAVYDRGSVVPFQIHASCFMGSVSPADSAFHVAACSLDDFIAQGNPEPDVVKLDVEGGESAVLRGAEKLLKKRKTTWVVSTHGPKQTRSCLAVFSGFRYTLQSLDGSSISGKSEESLSEIVAIP